MFIDDATGRLTQLYFAPSETTAAYREVLRRQLALFGHPVGLYSDRHSIFQINRGDPANGHTQTQFGRALEGLQIEAIHAHTPPQAKGRVERANQTLQDRLVKELRLRGISDIGSANAFLLNSTEQTSAELQEQSAHTINLADYSNALRESVGVFKLSAAAA